MSNEEEVVEAEAEPDSDPLADALARAEKAEAEITYRDAEIINIRRRAATDRADLLRFGAAGLAARILPVLDSLEKAIEGAEEGPLREGILLTRDNLVEALAAEGVKPITVDGVFDPATMEALTTVPASEAHPDGSVVDTLESGWMQHDRVLRPARVVVSKE